MAYSEHQCIIDKAQELSQNCTNVKNDEDNNVDVFSLSKLAYMTCTDQEKSWYNSFKTTPKFDIKGCCLLMRDISIDYRTRMMSMIPHAVQNNHLNCLKIIVKQGLIVPNNGEIIRLAMALGHLDIVKYLIESVYKGGNINNEIHGPETFFFILRHLSFLKTVHRRKCKLDANKIVLMVCRGAVLHDDCIISMHEQNCSWRDDKWMESYASKNRYLGIARIISPFNNSRIWTTKQLIIDARMDNLVTSQRAVCDPVMDLIDRIECCMNHIISHIIKTN